MGRRKPTLGAQLGCFQVAAGGVVRAPKRKLLLSNFGKIVSKHGRRIIEFSVKLSF